MSTTFTVRIPDELNSKLEARLSAERRTRNALVCLALEDYLLPAPAPAATKSPVCVSDDSRQREAQSYPVG